MKSISKICVVCLLVACQPRPHVPQSDSPSWQLLPAQSTLSFVTTKNKVHTEEHSLQFQSGQFIDQALELVIDLNSVDTLIPIRDERMRNILFQTEDFPTATVTTMVPPDVAHNQPVALPFVLDLHGHQKTFEVEVIVDHIDDQLVVVNYESLLVNAKDFHLDGGVNQLTKIAGLKSINYEVLVDFKLVFEK